MTTLRSPFPVPVPAPRGLTTLRHPPSWKPARHECPDLPNHEVVQLLDRVTRDVRLLVRVADAGVIREEHVLPTGLYGHRSEQELCRLVDAARGHGEDRDPARRGV